MVAVGTRITPRPLAQIAACAANAPGFTRVKRRRHMVLKLHALQQPLALRSKRARRKRKTTVTAQTQTRQIEGSVDLVKSPVPWSEKPNDIKPNVTVRHGADVAAYAAAIALAGAAAWFSISGMVVLFPGSPMSVIAMAVAMESAKLVTAG